MRREMMTSKNRIGASASLASGRSALVLAAAAAMPLIVASGARAVTVTWDGETDGLWGTATNWDTNALPVNADDVVFATPTAANLTLAMTAAETQMQSLTFNAGLPGNVTINTTNTTRLRVNGRTGDDVVVLGGDHVIGFTDNNVSPTVGFRHGAISFNIAAGASLNIAARMGAVNSGNSFTKNGDGLLVLSAGNGGTTGWNVSGGTGGSTSTAASSACPAPTTRSRATAATASPSTTARGSSSARSTAPAAAR